MRKETLGGSVLINLREGSISDSTSAVIAFVVLPNCSRMRFASSLSPDSSIGVPFLV